MQLEGGQKSVSPLLITEAAEHHTPQMTFTYRERSRLWFREPREKKAGSEESKIWRRKIGMENGKMEEKQS